MKKSYFFNPSYRFFLNPKLADFKLGKLKLSFGNNKLQNSCNIVRDLQKISSSFAVNLTK